MTQSFESILAAMLEQYEKNPSQDVDALINSKMQELGISEEGKQMLQETNKYLTAFDEQYASLKEAKEQGKSRKSWILKKMDTIMEGRTEAEKVQIVTAISETSEKSIEQIISQEQ